MAGMAGAEGDRGWMGGEGRRRMAAGCIGLGWFGLEWFGDRRRERGKVSGGSGRVVRFWAGRGSRHVTFTSPAGRACG